MRKSAEPRTVMAWADAIRRALPDHRVEVYSWSHTPYRKPKGLRYRTWQGKTRTGPALFVYASDGREVYRYVSVEPYRRLADVREWLTLYQRTQR